MEETNKTPDDDPIMVLHCSSYPATVSTTEAFSAMNGQDGYDDMEERIIWSFTDDKTIDGLIRSAMETRLDPSQAQDMMTTLDAIAESDRDIIGESLTTGHKWYVDMEKAWVREHDLADIMGMFQNNHANEKSMVNANDDDWMDAFILNFRMATRGRERYAGSDTMESWRDLVDDLMLMYMAPIIYMGIHRNGKARVYSI